MKWFTAYCKPVSLLLIAAMLATIVPPNPSLMARASSLEAAGANQAAVGMSPTNEWVNFYSQNSALNGQSLPVGAVVRAYNPRGVQCGEFTVAHAGWYGLMPVYRDDPNTPSDEGMRPGEIVTFTINGAPATPMGQDAPVWTTNGDLKQVDLVAADGEIPHTHIYLPLIFKVTSIQGQGGPLPKASGVAIESSTVMIALHSGWNLISFPVMPADPDPTAVLSSIAGMFSVVLSYDRGGLSYYPNLPPSMNTLRTMDGYHGYWIKMNSPGTLSVNGERLAEKDRKSVV